MTIPTATLTAGARAGATAALTAARAGATAAPTLLRTGLNLVQIKDDLWRATVADGRILGHIERRDGTDGTMFIAKRLIPAQARFNTLGEFWRMDDAMDCLHAL